MANPKIIHFTVAGDSVGACCLVAQLPADISMISSCFSRFPLEDLVASFGRKRVYVQVHVCACVRVRVCVCVCMRVHVPGHTDGTR